MLGTVIKNYINDKGFIQSRIAEKANMPINTFNDILNERRKIETLEYFKICSALGVNTEFFKEKLVEMNLINLVS